jgi:hypothetical protein
MMGATTPIPSPDPGTIATALASDVGGQVVGAAVAIAPVAVPFVLGLTAIGWVLKKFGLKKKASLNV